uniref:Ig-like domain-containing protein n=1 Tax=Coturnix japonica TaxID=93934 RepID=A0A8C2UH28_COTJA
IKLLVYCLCLTLLIISALVVPREVSGQEGETLSVRCWYSRGYEGYNKYWCRGAARGSCHKVVETAGRDVPRQHGRVSITDNHIFCVVLLTVQELSMEDAGSYWCGVERAGWDIMEPVTVRVTPGDHYPRFLGTGAGAKCRTSSFCAGEWRGRAWGRWAGWEGAAPRSSQGH